MFDFDRVRHLGDFLDLFRPTGGRGKKSGGSKRASKKVGKVKSKTIKKKSGGSKRTIKAKPKKSGGQKSVRRTQRSVSPSRSKKA